MIWQKLTHLWCSIFFSWLLNKCIFITASTIIKYINIRKKVLKCTLILYLKNNTKTSYITCLGVITIDALKSQYLFIFNNLSFFVNSYNLIICNNSVHIICWDSNIFSNFNNGNKFNWLSFVILVSLNLLFYESLGYDALNLKFVY